MKAIIFARVSTKRQENEGLSIDDQADTLREYAKKKDIKIVKEFIFQESAGNKIRKRFDEMLEYIKKNKDVKAILAYRVDRMTRNYRDAVLLDSLRIEKEIELHFVHNRLVLRHDSVGRDIQDWDLQVFLAKQYLNRLQEDGVNTHKYKARNGELAGKAPVGYLNVELENKKKWVEIDEERAPLVKKAFEWYATGNYSVKKIAKILKEKGLTNPTKALKPLVQAQIYEMLKNPFYYGEIRLKGKLYPHKYEPLIPRWLYEKCQNVRESYQKNPRKYASKPFVFRGLIKCAECGCTITSDKKKGKYTYCYCTKYKGNCNGVRIREEELTAQIEKIFDAIKIPENVMPQLTKEIRKNHKNEKDFYEANIKRIQRQLKTVRNRIKTMYEDRLDQRITTNEYDKMLVLEKQKERDLIAELEAHSEADEDFAITSIYLLELANRTSELFKSSKVEQKQHLINFVLSNLQLKGKKLLYEAKKPFDLLLQMTKNQNWLQRLEYIARYFAFEKGAYCPNLRLEERMANETDEWVMA